MIKIENVSKQIDDNLILDNVSLTVLDKTKLGIVGLSGAGKSTLIRTINGLVSLSSGEIYIDDVNINSLNNKDLQSLRKNLGMIFQHFNLLEQYNVYNNIKISLDVLKTDKESSDIRIKELLDLVGLSDKANDYPKTLSGGEKQRVAIARALATNPKYLLCDEVTSALDLKTSYEILDLLHDINEKLGVTIIFVSHDIDAIKYLCDRVIVMDNGKIVEENNTLDLFINPKKDITKRLINRKMFDLSKSNIKNLYQITYINDANNNHLISKAIKKFDVDINILFGEVITINKKDIGFLYVTIEGKDSLEVVKYLRVETEVIKYV